MAGWSPAETPEGVARNPPVTRAQHKGATKMESTIERIDEHWMADSGMLDGPSKANLRGAADSFQRYLEEVDGAEWKGGDRWEFPSADDCCKATESWLDALNTRADLRW